MVAKTGWGVRDIWRRRRWGGARRHAAAFEHEQSERRAVRSPEQKSDGHMRHRVYFDTQLIDYLYHHANEIWNGGEEDGERWPPLASPVLDGDRLAALHALPTLAYRNWRIVLGKQVFRQLQQIRDSRWRQELLEYAGKLMSLSEMHLYPDEHDNRRRGPPQDAHRTGDAPRPGQLSLPFLDRMPSPRDESLASLPPTDRPLVVEAITLRCDVFLTADERLARKGEEMKGALAVSIRRLSDFVGEEARCPIHDLDPPVPDLLLLTGMLPGGSF